MFFLLSKILAFVINPFYWILFLLLYSIFGRVDYKRKLALKWGVGLTLFFTNSVIFLEFARVWEPNGQKIEEVKHYDVAVVLGGMAEYNNDLDRLSLRRGGDRLWQTINLYHLGKVDKILISGDSGYILDKGLKEAEQFKKILVENGIPPEDVLVESKSKNTYQNAFESKLILDQTPENESVLLVTSATHMRRSIGCFEKVGFKNFGTFTTDHYTGQNRHYFLDQYLVPNQSVLTDWQKLIHEWVGYMVYWMVGYL
ncbi:MAG: YdcF family protein [Putridiphycobacter sp.]